MTGDPVEHLFRHESGRLVAALTRVFGFHNLALAEDVVRDDFLFAALGLDEPTFLRKAFPALHVEFVLVAQAAHQPSARARDLARVEREMLILRYLQVHRAQLGEPRRRAVLATAATDAAEPLRLVANADLLQLDARADG